MFRKSLILVVVVTAILTFAVSSSSDARGLFDNHIELLSVPPDTSGYSDVQKWPSPSFDERFGVFTTQKTNPQNPSTYDSFVMVRDIENQQTEVLSIPWEGDTQEFPQSAWEPRISGDGQYVVYSTASYVPSIGDDDTFTDIYLYDRLSHQTSLVSKFPAGVEDGYVDNPQISVDARYVIFRGYVTLPAGCSQFFVFDRESNESWCIEEPAANETIKALFFSGMVPYAQTQVNNDIYFYWYDLAHRQLHAFTFANGEKALTVDLTLSPNGRYALFTKYYTQAGECHVYLNDLQENNFICLDETPLKDITFYSWGVSSDGDYVVVESPTALVSADKNFIVDVYLYQISTHRLSLVSYSQQGQSGDYYSEDASFSAAGKYILFISAASDLVDDTYNPPSTYPLLDGYIYNLQEASIAPTRQPVIFIPGVAGSLLERASDGTQLWPTLRTQENLQQQLSLKPGETVPISANDVIRNFLDGQISIDEFAVYEPFLKTLRLEGGYLEYVPTGEACDTTQTFATLFVFPYDFRSGASDENVTRLKNLIDCVRTIHPDQKVNIVAHSMGGLLSRKYILNNLDHHVDQLITIATPWLGAPQAINVLLTGDWLPQVIAPNTTRSLAEYWTATHQLLPNQQYFSLAKDHLGLRDQPMAILNQDPQNANSYQFHSVTREEFNDVLQSRYSSPSSSVDFIGHNDALFDSPDFADWTNDQSGVTHTVIFGDTRAENTIVQFYERHDRTCNLFGCSYIFNWDTLMGRGDETVPLLSSTRKGTGYDLNGNATLYRFAQGQDEDMSHLGLIHSRRVQDCVMAILEVEGKECLADSNVIAAGAEQDQSTPIDYLRIWGVSSLEVSDGISTTGDLFDSTNQIHHVDEVKFNYLGTDSILIMLPHDLAYVVDATATDRFFVEVTYGTGENSTQFQRYIDSSVMSGTAVRIDASNDIFQMTYDRDNDGKPETLVTPTSDLAGDVISDTNAPTVTLTIEPVNRTVTITATDDASGVGRIFYSLDGTKFNKYDQLLQIGDEKTVVYAQAEDQVGNLSEVVSLIVEQKPGFLFLPLVRR